MKTFLKTFIAFILFSFLISCSFIFYYAKKYDLNFSTIPAPHFNNNYSFNDKLDFSRNKQADILTIGSSMSLNNLSSNIIVENFKSKSYLNLSAWGLQIPCIFDLLKINTQNYKPKVLIISSNTIDFGDDSESSQHYDLNELDDFLHSKYSLLFHLKHFNIEYYKDNCRLIKLIKSSRTMYKSLKYDQYGGVEFEPKNFMISPERWSQDYITFANIKGNKNYESLDSISSFCFKHQIKLLFFQSPTRSVLIDENEQKNLDLHIKRIKKMVEKRGHFFVNSNGREWDDSLYVDGIHLNSKGSKLYTKYCFDQLNTDKSYVQFIKKWNK